MKNQFSYVLSVIILMTSVSGMQGSIVSKKNIQCRYLTELMNKEHFSKHANGCDSVAQLLFAQRFQQKLLNVHGDVGCIMSRYYALALYGSYSDVDKDKCRSFFSLHNADFWSESLTLFDSLHHDLDTFFFKLAQGLLSDKEVSDILVNQCRSIAYAVRPTHLIMTEGGDNRLHLDPVTGVNKYHTSSIPLLDEISRSSCTSSRPTQQAFESAEMLRQKIVHEMLADNEEIFECAATDLRNRIKKSLSIPSSIHAIVTPSGSDAEMVFTLLAMGGHYGEYSASRVCNIVVAGGEVGSGTAGAAGGRHFSVFTPLGAKREKEAFVEGFSDSDVRVVQCATRDKETGRVIPKNILEQRLENIIAKAIKDNNESVVLHMVHSSKTSVGTPSIAFLQKMKKAYGNKIIIVIDAAQCRFSLGTLEKLLNEDFCVLATGSKFFAGAPFSGIVLIPDSQAQPLKEGIKKLPPGVCEYFSSYDVDDSLPGFKKQLPSIANIGLLLRWETALFEMERFAKVDEESKKNIAQQWALGVRQMIKNYASFVQLEDALEGHYLAEKDLVLGGCNTVVSFVVRKDNTWFSVPELKIIHGLMSQDISERLPTQASDQDKKVASVKCLIGQPVKVIGEKGVLRIALSAPMVSMINNTSSENIVGVPWVVQRHLLEDKIVLDKLDIIARYYQALI